MFLVSFFLAIEITKVSSVLKYAKISLIEYIAVSQQHNLLLVFAAIPSPCKSIAITV